MGVGGVCFVELSGKVGAGGACGWLWIGGVMGWWVVTDWRGDGLVGLEIVGFWGKSVKNSK